MHKSLTSIAAVMMILATAARGADVPIGWDYPYTNHSATGFSVHYGHASRTYPEQQDAAGADVRQIKVTALDASRTWYFGMTAFNVHGGRSAYSDELVWDNVPPAITGPDSVSVTMPAGAPVVAPDWRGLFAATDDVSMGLSVQQAPAPGEPLDGVAQVVFSAVDEAGNVGELRLAARVTIEIVQPVAGVTGQDDRGRALQRVEVQP